MEFAGGAPAARWVTEGRGRNTINPTVQDSGPSFAAFPLIRIRGLLCSCEYLKMTLFESDAISGGSSPDDPLLRGSMFIGGSTLSRFHVGGFGCMQGKEEGYRE